MRRRRLLALALAAALPILAGAPALAREEKKKGGGVGYIQMLALTGTVIRPDHRRGVLTVEVGLDVPDQALHDLANQSQPRLRAGFVEFIIGYAAHLSPGSPPDADYIEMELQRRANQLLGRPGARVLLGTILVS